MVFMVYTMFLLFLRLVNRKYYVSKLLVCPCVSSPAEQQHLLCICELKLPHVHHITEVHAWRSAHARECADVNKMHSVKSLSDLATRVHCWV